jgi:hypothetical protein
MLKSTFSWCNKSSVALIKAGCDTSTTWRTSQPLWQANTHDTLWKNSDIINKSYTTLPLDDLPDFPRKATKRPAHQSWLWYETLNLKLGHMTATLRAARSSENQTRCSNNFNFSASSGSSAHLEWLWYEIVKWQHTTAFPTSGAIA